MLFGVCCWCVCVVCSCVLGVVYGVLAKVSWLLRSVLCVCGCVVDGCSLSVVAACGVLFVWRLLCVACCRLFGVFCVVLFREWCLWFGVVCGVLLFSVCVVCYFAAIVLFLFVLGWLLCVVVGCWC